MLDLVFRVRVTYEGAGLAQHAETAYTPDPGNASKSPTPADIDLLVTEMMEAARTGDPAESRIVLGRRIAGTSSGGRTSPG